MAKLSASTKYLKICIGTVFWNIKVGGIRIYPVLNSYKNSYQESLKMAPFKVLYGGQCRTPLNWIELREKVIFTPDLVEEAEATVHSIQDNLKATKLRQETYANKRC
jgi:hypothetical protein